jgi:hypothetical protein
MNITTLADLKNFLETLSDEDLEQPARIAGNDGPDSFISNAGETFTDVWMNKHDSDDHGSLDDLKAYHEDFEIDDYRKIASRGEIYFCTQTTQP